MGSDEFMKILGMNIQRKEFQPANRLGLYGGYGSSFWFKPVAEDWPMVWVMMPAAYE